MITEVSAAPRRSAFVTALAWVFIVLAGFATLISALQNVMIAVMFPVAEMQAAADQAKNDERMPWLAAFMFQNIRLFFFAFLVLCVVTLTAAIGLLKRKNWARVLFIALMGLGVLWNIGGVVFSIVFFSSLPPTPATAPYGFGDQFEVMSKVIIGFNIVLAVGFTVLFGWISKRLFSRDIRREFSAG
jgi:magnesium-transporting ATPase (P-type)